MFFVAMGAELALCWRGGRLSGERPIWRFVDAVVAARLYVAVYDAATIAVLSAGAFFRLGRAAQR